MDIKQNLLWIIDEPITDILKRAIEHMNPQQNLKKLLIKNFQDILLKYPITNFIWSVIKVIIFILAHIVLLWLVFFTLLPWLFSILPTTIKFDGIPKDIIKFDIGQFLVFVGALITAYIAWIKYLGTQVTQQFNELSKNASSTEELICANALATLPIFSLKPKESIFEHYLTLKDIKDKYVNFFDWTFKPKTKNDNPDCYLKDYHQKFPYVQESVNIIINVLKNEAKKRPQVKIDPMEDIEEYERDEIDEVSYSYLEQIASEALSKINQNSYNEELKVSAVDLSKKNCERIRFYEVDLTGANLQGTNLHSAHLEWAYLSGAHLEGAHLQGAHLQGAHLQVANLLEAHLQGAHLQGAYLTVANLQGAHLQGAYLERANLKGAYLERANLKGAYLERAHLEEAHLQGAHLEVAHLQGAHLEGAYLQGAYLNGAHLELANLQGAHLKESLLLKTIFDNLQIYEGIDLLNAIVDLESYNKYQNTVFSGYQHQPIEDLYKKITIFLSLIFGPDTDLEQLQLGNLIPNKLTQEQTDQESTSKT